MGGKKSEPTALKAVKGIRDKRSYKNKPKVSGNLPGMPKWLDSYSKRIWKSLARGLYEAGCLSHEDRASFATYCQAVSDYKHAAEILTKDGLTISTPQGVKMHPAYRVKKNAAAEIRAFGSEFGLSPSARMSLDVKPPKVEEEKPARKNTAARLMDGYDGPI